MSFRFRKSIKIMPGVRVNLFASKSGLSPSLSVGPRGASVSVGKRGVHGNVGLPGTGVSYRTKLSGGSSTPNNRGQVDNTQPIQSNGDERLASVDFETGAVTIAPGYPDISTTQRNKMFREHKDGFVEYIQSLVDVENGLANEIATVHYDCVSPSTPPVYHKLTFHRPDPVKPTKELPPAEMSWIMRKIRPGKVQKRADEIAAQDAQYARWLAQYNAEVANNNADRLTFNANQTALEKSFHESLATDRDSAEEYLAEVFGNLVWPCETIISFELSDDMKTLTCDVDLPELEHMPDTEYKLLTSGKRVSTKPLTDKTKRNMYLSHVHGIVLRIASHTLSSLQVVDFVRVLGYTQRIDKSDGIEKDEYVIDATFDRSGMENIGWDNIDVVDVIEVVNTFNTTSKVMAGGQMKTINVSQ
jgi:hypothetical protein